VIRYDHRDTGQSVSYPPGKAGYTGDDLTDDAVGVIDGFDLLRAHLVGISMGGGIAQEIALDRPDRVASLTLISSFRRLTARRSPLRSPGRGCSPSRVPVTASRGRAGTWSSRRSSS
jgi:pimeloyl-ACP methyl ester carboxylesterase